jgi:membrane-bound serine protease (ClpP class)
MLEILLDPNVGYLLLVGGFVLAVLALFAPGTGLLEIGALFALLLAGYTLVNLPVNAWAVVVVVLGIVPLFLALRRTQGRQGLYLVLAGIALLIVGSIFVFRAPGGGPAVNPLLGVVVSGGAGLLLWFIARKSLDAAKEKPVHNLDGLIGMTGTVRTDLRPEGSVYVDGEEWSATSKSYIAAGTRVRVIARNGLDLEVEKFVVEDK